MSQRRPLGPRSVWGFTTLTILVVGLAVAQPAAATVEVDPAIELALGRLYNFAFDDAHALLDAYIADAPDDPLGRAFRGATFLFYELDRLRILESEFFKDDENFAEQKKLKPDPEIRRRMMLALERTAALAEARLALDPNDVEALFALSLREGMLTDYFGLVEKRKLKSFSSARAANRYSDRLLALEPELYDAYLSGGVNEYLLGSLPFFIRWFARIDGIEGSKELAFERLHLVAERGRYLGPFARILMSIMSRREKRPDQARELLAGLSRDYPENPLIRKELRKVSERLAAGERTTAR